jgi:OmpA-OmpF porin, OOP family
MLSTSSIFDSLVADIAGRFNLGSRADTLVEEALHFITSRSGGISGFLDMFKTAGLGKLVSSWLGHTDNPPLSTQQVEQVLGNNVTGGLASKLGVGGGVAGSALAYVVPKLIGLLTPGGVVPAGIPADVSAFLSSHTAQAAAPRAVAEPMAKEQSHYGKWIIPALIGLLLLGALWSLLRGRLEEKAVTKPIAVEATPAVQAMAAVQPKLSLSNDSGVLTVSGTVKDEATKTSILNSLKAAFGASNVKGDITVNPDAASAAWLTSLKAAVDVFNTPWIKVNLEGKAISVGGLTDAARDKILGSLKPLFGNDFSFGPLTENP